jgi:DNA end-binding protein Ku
MPPRPNWKGYLKLSLVSCPIALYPATSGSERVSFRQVNKQTGNRLKQQLVDSVTGEPVGPEDKGRGYEIGKNQFLMVEDEELEAIEIESTRTIEIDTFVPREQIDDRYLDAPYYIAPTDTVGQEAFAVIREAMRGKGMVALGRVVMSKREYVIALEPFEKGLKATTLRYPYEVREASAYFEDIPDLKIPGEMLKLAEHILDSKAADFDPSTFEDRYETALTEMLRKKQAGLPVPKEAPAAQPANVVNLMDALKRSLQKEGGGRTRAAAPAPAPEKARPQAREPQRAAAARKPQKKARRAG